MIAFIIGSVQERGYVLGNKAPAPMGDGRVCIGIQTRIGEHLCRQGATSDVVCTRKPAAICCDYMSLAHGCCTRPIGHPGAHVFGARKPEAKA